MQFFVASVNGPLPARTRWGREVPDGITSGSFYWFIGSGLRFGFSPKQCSFICARSVDSSGLPCRACSDCPAFSKFPGYARVLRPSPDPQKTCPKSKGSLVLRSNTTGSGILFWAVLRRRLVEQRLRGCPCCRTSNLDKLCSLSISAARNPCLIPCNPSAAVRPRDNRASFASIPTVVR